MFHSISEFLKLLRGMHCLKERKGFYPKTPEKLYNVRSEVSPKTHPKQKQNLECLEKIYPNQKYKPLNLVMFFRVKICNECVIPPSSNIV
jgi:hypothetical protein